MVPQDHLIVVDPSLSIHELVQAEDGSEVALPGEGVVLVGGDVGGGEACLRLDQMVFGGGAFGGGDGAAEGQLVGEVEAVGGLWGGLFEAGGEACGAVVDEGVVQEVERLQCGRTRGSR